MSALDSVAAAPVASSAAPAVSGGQLAAPQTLMSQDGDTALPAEVAYLPAANPAASFPAIPAAPAAPDAASQPPIDPAASASDGAEAGAQAAADPAAASQPGQADAAPGQAAASAVPDSAPLPSQRPVQPGDDAGAALASADPAPQTAAPPAPASAPPAKKSFLSSLFSSGPGAKAAVPQSARQQPTPVVRQALVAPAAQAPAVPVLAAAQPKPLIADAPAKPIIAIDTPGAKPIIMASLGSSDALPGVRQTALFEITRKSGGSDDSDIDLNEEEGGGPIRLASAAGMARMSPGGMLTQNDSVDVSCLRPSLVAMLKQVEQHYSRPVMVTSGFRDAHHNREARGARNSLHMYCAAADIQVAGVSKWELASYVRSVPGRGGVGTYCYTESVHVDVGPERDWNWRCRRRK